MLHAAEHTRNTYYGKYPVGALKTRNEVLDLVIEARKEKKAIRIWTVNQLGRISAFYIYSKTKLYNQGAPNPCNDGLEKVLFNMLYPVIHDHTIISHKKTNMRWFKTHEFIGSYGVEETYNTEHRMFTNKRAATNYSNTLKNDPKYRADVEAHHQECAKLFSSFDDYND